MGIHILLVGVMHIIRNHQRNIQLAAHFHQLRIHRALLGNAVILHLQKVVSLSEACLVLFCRLARFIHKSLHDIALHFPGKTCGQGNDPLMVPVQNLHIHPRFVVIALGKAPAHDLHQIGITGVVLGKKHQMIVPVLPACQLLVKP